MSVPIRIIHNPSYDCYDNLIIALSKYWNKNYEMMSLNSWGFLYDSTITSNILGNKIKENSCTNYNLLESFHGIKSISNSQKNPYKIIEDIKTEITCNRPVAIYVNTFWSPWYSSDYQKINGDHYCLAIDTDPFNNIKIVDSQFANDGALLPFNDYINGYGDYTTFEQVPIKNDLNNWPFFIWDSIKQLSPIDSKSIFEQMRDLSSEILKSLDLNIEVIGYENDPFTAPIFQNIFYIGRRRKQFSISLSYIGKNCNVYDLNIISNRMYEIGNKWSATFGLLCKSYYLGKNFNIINKLCTRIKELADEEEQVFEMLRSICHKEDLKSISKSFLTVPDHNSDHITDLHFVNIKDYVNNQGFGNSLDFSCTAEISNGGRYFYMEKTNIYSEFKCKNMTFKTLIDNNNDNISCLGQKITIPSISANYIMFLGCSEIGDHLEYIQIEYENGIIENIPVGFTNWSKSNTAFKEILALEVKAAQRNTDKIFLFPFPAHIYAKNFKMKTNSLIKSIQLPLCPNMHIFSITLGSNKI